MVSPEEIAHYGTQRVTERRGGVGGGAEGKAYGTESSGKGRLSKLTE